jgi:hypothetical protein
MEFTTNLQLYKPRKTDTKQSTLDELANNADKIEAEFLHYLNNVMWYGAKGDGTTDDTIAFQTALDKKGRIVIPSATYLVGGLVIHSNTQLVGIGNVTLKYKSGVGFQSPFGNALIVNENLPTYYASGDANRQTVYNVANNITIKNVTLELQNAQVNAIQLVCVDYASVEDVLIQNGNEAGGDGGAGLDLRACRYSEFRNVRCNNVNGDDIISVTDANFKPLNYNGLHNGISRDLLFENCRVENSTNDGAFELDDGMLNVTFLNCIAENNTGQAYDLHLHSSEYDLQNIAFINCKSINNKAASTSIADQQKVAGFILGQCPDGSRFKNITLENCVSVGSPMALYCPSGAQTGYKENISIIGGYFENTWTTDGTIQSYNAVMYLGKQFRSFKVMGANVVGCTDSYAFYSYGTADGLKLSNVSVKDCYIPLGLTHVGGRVEINAFTFAVTNPSSALSSVCLAIECDDVTINGIVGSLDQSKYSASIARFIGVKKGSIVGLEIENAGTLGNNGIQLDTVGYVTLTANIIKNFVNAVYFSNTSTSVVSVGNIFKTCTNKYNSTPAYLVDAGNAI